MNASDSSPEHRPKIRPKLKAEVKVSLCLDFSLTKNDRFM